MSCAVPLSVAVARARNRPAASPRLQLCHGSCRCGTLRFAVRIDPDISARCICARCRGMGLRVGYALRADFRLLTGREDLTEPLSDARTPHHFFCGRCGEAGFGFPTGTDGPEKVSVNLAFLARGGVVDPSVLPDAPDLPCPAKLPE